MSAILMPEVIIYETLQTIVRMLRKDLIDNTENEEKTILYKLLGVDEDNNVLKMNLYNFFKQGKKIIEYEENLSVNFGYNQDRARIISLHIILPSEQGEGAIGMDEGYVQDYSEEDGLQQYFTNSFKSNYQIMITSTNSSEVNLVYNILKSMLLMLYEQLEVRGLRNPSLSGNDIVMQDDLTPIPLFHKVLNLTFFYELNVPKVLVNEIIKNFYFEGQYCHTANVSVEV